MDAPLQADAHRSTWVPPPGAHVQADRLRLHNSYTGYKELFVPHSNGKHISWYTCGPTVYDSAHMGHARNYVTFDILRRVLEDFFGYDILFVMNITDVDDKIILRARRNHLLQLYRQQAHDPQQVRADARAALDRNVHSQSAKAAEAAQELQELQASLEAKPAGEVPATVRRRAKDLEAAHQMESRKLENWTTARAALDGVSSHADGLGQEEMDQVLAVAGDALAEWQDSLHKGEVTEYEIFRRHAARFEEEFLRDMRDLGCREPTVLTRVSEYMHVIVAYIQQIMDKGYAYEANGSVYFDTQAFRTAGHTYGKLNPWAVGSKALACEGEADFETQEKRGAHDFALWKTAKLGEPSWESPWGRGRPGWHIECSAMASSVIGAHIDIHTGGEDLRFPHHDNELAQAEAYYSEGAPSCSCNGRGAAGAVQAARGGQWVNYFLHSGHLSIEGLKMSKALKNFITIRAVLKQLSMRQLRLLFVMSPWHQPMSYGEGALTEMRAKEAVLRKFFQNVDVALRGSKTSTGGVMLAADGDLEAATRATATAVHERLCDSIDTRGALDKLLDLIALTNKYLEQRDEKGGAVPLQPLLLRRVAALVTRVLRVFGLSTAAPDELGFGNGFVPQLGAVLDTACAFCSKARDQAVAAGLSELRAAVLEKCDRAAEGFGRSGAAAASVEAALDALTGFRCELRKLARDDKAPAGKDLGRSLLAACDWLRDAKMVELGVRMEDVKLGTSNSSVWKLEDPAILRAELEEAQRAIEAAAEKKKLAAQQREQAAQKKEQARLNKLMREAEKQRKKAEAASIGTSGVVH